MPASERAETPRGYTVAFALVVCLFLLWGIANSLNDILIPQFKKAFVLSDLQTGLVQSAFYGGYFLLAIPASLFMRAYGYKAAVVCGLLIYAVGAALFYPAAETHQYGFFLGALSVIASGLSFLETSANPLVAGLGSPETSERRLNFAQAFNPLGVISGVFIGRWFILSDETSDAAHAAAYYAAQAHAVVGPYLTLSAGVLLWALLVAWVRFPPIATARDARGEGAASYGGLLRHPRYLFGVVAQFFYVGAQVGVWSFMIRYIQFAEPVVAVRAAADILFWSLVGFTVGRFAGTALMGRIHPERLMAAYAAAAVALTAIAATVGGWIGIYCLAATSFFMSIMFPTIFAGAIRDLGPLTKPGSSFLVMAIVGGALTPPAMGWISGMVSMQMAMFVPCACFAVILAFALMSRGRAS